MFIDKSQLVKCTKWYNRERGEANSGTLNDQRNWPTFAKQKKYYC